jgi:hypothetical protein
LAVDDDAALSRRRVWIGGNLHLELSASLT